MKIRSIIKRKDEWQLQQKIPRTEKTKFDSENLQILQAGHRQNSQKMAKISLPPLESPIFEDSSKIGVY